jgi:CBS domain-containing protein
MSAFDKRILENQFENDLATTTPVQTVARFCPDPVITADADLGEVFATYALGRGHQRYVIEDENGRFLGILTASIFDDVDRDDWLQTPAREVMTPAADVLRVAPQTALKQAIDMLHTYQTHRVYVVQEDHLVGVIEREDIVEFMAFQSTLRA